MKERINACMNVLKERQYQVFAQFAYTSHNHGVNGRKMINLITNKPIINTKI